VIRQLLAAPARGGLLTQCGRRAARQAAREIAGTIASSNNRVFLNSDSLLLNLVRARRCPAPAARGRLPGRRGRPQPSPISHPVPYPTTPC